MIVIDIARRPTQSFEESWTDSGLGFGVFCMVDKSCEGLDGSEE